MPEPQGGERAIVFLDRDGTISDDKGYTCRPADMRIFPGAGRAVGALKRSGFLVVVVTNQSAVGRGMATEAEIVATNEECLRQLLLEDDSAHVDRLCFCPHLPDDGCSCRKPLPGMVLNNSFPWIYSRSRSWVVGDKPSDLEFGLALGIPAAQCILVLTGEGARERAGVGDRFPTTANLTDAAAMIVGGASASRE